MSLNVGAKLGPYEILSKLGEGGMGEVYRARDSKLDRDVAIKVLPATFALDADRVARFSREAKTLASLNHPHIAAIYGIEQAGDTQALVMELVEGEDLSQIIARGPIALADALPILQQIADALDAAHAQGVIHRDLKPANIKVRADGTVKLLDFGLAKAIDPTDSGASAVANSPTLTARATQMGMILGTAAYMAPEQAKGRAVDRRADVWAFGVVLYEMLTGDRAFKGDDVSDTLASVLKDTPNWTALPAGTPPRIRQLLGRCLERDLRLRQRDMGDVLIELNALAGHRDEEAVAPAPAAKRSSLRVAGIVAAALALGLTGGWMLQRQAGNRSQASREVTSLGITLPAGLSVLDGGANPSIAMSPDGRAVAFCGLSKDGIAIYLRRLENLDVVKIAGTDGGEGPFFSPRADWMGFWENGQIKKVPIGGGAPVVVTDAPALRGAVWLDDDTIVYSPLPTAGLMSVSANGGTPKTLTTLDATRQEKTHRRLIGLPGGKAVVFTIGSNEIGLYDEARIVALTLATGKITEILKDGYSPVYAPSGHLLYINHHKLFAVPFDAATLKASGSPVQVLEDVASQPEYGMADLGLSSSGAVAYATGGDRVLPVAIRWMDRKGNFQPIPAEERAYGDMAVSQDGRKLALTVSGANNVLMSYDLASHQFTRITFRLDVESPTWTPDDTITYWSGSDVRTIASDGSGKEEVLISAADVKGRSLLPLNWSKDGQKLALLVETPGQRPDLGVYLKADKRLVLVAQTRFDEDDGLISPDGQWLLYRSNESGRFEVFVRASDGTGRKYPVTNEGGFQLMWAKDGRELIYGTPKGLVASTFTATPTPTIGPPELLIPLDKAEGLDIVKGGSMPDGQRFIVLVRKTPTPVTEIKVVTNWTDRLKGLWK